MIAFLVIVIAILTLALVLSAAENYHLLGEVERLTEARHDSRPRGDLPPARPGTSLLTPAEAAAHADAMHAVSEPFLPAGQHAQARPRLTERTVRVAATGDAPPWDIPTSSFPVPSQAEQDERAAFVRSRLPLHGEDATREDFDRALALLRERTAAELPPAPGWQQACTANVLAAEQEGREVA